MRESRSDRTSILNRHSNTQTLTRASSLLHRDFELDALALDNHPPRLNFEDAKRRDDVSFSDQITVNHCLGLWTHHGALQLQLTRLLAQVLDQVVSLLLLIGLSGDRLCELIPE